MLGLYVCVQSGVGEVALATAASEVPALDVTLRSALDLRLLPTLS